MSQYHFNNEASINKTNNTISSAVNNFLDDISFDSSNVTNDTLNVMAEEAVDFAISQSNGQDLNYDALASAMTYMGSKLENSGDKDKLRVEINNALTIGLHANEFSDDSIERSKKLLSGDSSVLSSDVQGQDESGYLRVNDVFETTETYNDNRSETIHNFIDRHNLFRGGDNKKDLEKLIEALVEQAFNSDNANRSELLGNYIKDLEGILKDKGLSDLTTSMHIQFGRHIGARTASGQTTSENMQTIYDVSGLEDNTAMRKEFEKGVAHSGELKGQAINDGDKDLQNTGKDYDEDDQNRKGLFGLMEKSDLTKKNKRNYVEMMIGKSQH